jgi:hypothetical protein
LPWYKPPWVTGGAAKGISVNSLGRSLSKPL